MNRINQMGTEQSMSISQAMKVLRLPNYYFARWKKDLLVAETILSTGVTESP